LFLSGITIDNFRPQQGSLFCDGLAVGCSWEDSYLIEQQQVKSLNRCIVSSANLLASQIQGFNLLTEWLHSADYNLLPAQGIPLFQKPGQILRHRYIENANLVSNELATNAVRGVTSKIPSPEYAFKVSPDGVFISVRDFFGTLELQSFLPSFKLGPKQAQVQDPQKGAGLGLFLVIRYSSVLIVESQAGVCTTASAFVPSRQDGTKIFYFNQI
jgi:hypothetical protein